MWVLLGPGDAALVPSPSYPIHIFAPLFAGASAREIPMSTDGNFIERVPRGLRVLVAQAAGDRAAASRTTRRRRRVDLDFFQQVVDFAREHEVVVVHDNAYAELGFDGFEPPSILQAEGAKECAVELYSMTKSFSMAGWRVAFLVGNAEVVQALAKLKSYLDYGTFQPIQIAATVTHERGRRHARRGAGGLPEPPRRAHRRARTASAGTCPGPRGTMFAWAPIPEPYRRHGLGRVRLDAGPRGAGGAVARRRASARAARATCASR